MNTANKVERKIVSLQSQLDATKQLLPEAQSGASLKPVGSGQPLPCPICKSDQYLGIKTVWIEYPGPKRKEEKMYFCAQCGLHAQPTYVDRFISEYWNRLVSHVESLTK